MIETTAGDLVAEERLITSVLLELMSEKNGLGFDEDPLRTLSRILVKTVPVFRFSVFCREGDFVWQEMLAEKDFCQTRNTPGPLTKFLKNAWGELAKAPIWYLDDCEKLAFLPREDIASWECKSCCALGVRDNGVLKGMVVVFFVGKRQADDTFVSWLELVSKVMSGVYTRHMVHRKLKMERDEAVEEAEKTERRRIDPELAEWIAANDTHMRIKCLVGLRGSGKSEVLAAYCHELLARGVDESSIVRIDFEDVRNRHLKTCDEVVGYLKGLPKVSGRRYLIMDEPAHVAGFEKLFGLLLRGGDWNVWVASSSARVVDPAVLGVRLLQRVVSRRIWHDFSVPRSRNTLARIWGNVLLNDVVSGLLHSDIRALEALAEYSSDKLAEGKSSRDVSAEFRASGRSFSHHTTLRYLESIENSYLLERSEIYDTRTHRKMFVPGRGFWMDLELRAWRFGPAPDREEERLQLNRLYLKLRRVYDKVYTPRDGKSDFVTVESDGSERRWNVSD